jgi:hypothetical protein
MAPRFQRPRLAPLHHSTPKSTPEAGPGPVRGTMLEWYTEVVSPQTEPTGPTPGTLYPASTVAPQSILVAFKSIHGNIS